MGSSAPLGRWGIVAGLVLLVVTSTGLGQPDAVEADPVSDVRQALLTFYKGGDAPSWKTAIETMLSDASGAPEAAELVRDLLQQSLADEMSGVAPWQATPFWGDSGRNPARELRKSVTDALSERPGSEAALPVYEWLLGNEELPALQAEIMTAVVGIETDTGSEIIARLIGERHPNSVVMVMALDAARDRKLDIAADELSPLCQHHRSNVRKAARALAKRLRHPKPEDFDLIAAMKSEAIADLMAEVGMLYLETAVADAPFVVVTFDAPGSEYTPERDVRGWLLAETGAAYTIMTPFGRLKEVPRTEEWDVPMTAVVTQVAIDDEVKRVAKLRASGDPKFELSTRGGLTGQFEGNMVTVYEITLAHWLYTHSRYEQAGKILLPALETLYCDSHLVDLATDKLGWIWGCQMLVAFVGDRDYDEAIRLAGLLTRQFAGGQFSYLARELKEELPKRREDFDTLTLPTAAEWNDMRASMTHQQQIEFLCQRFRLLNCFQPGQPARMIWGDPQFGEPGGLSDDAAWGGSNDGAEVINPYSLLTDSWGWREKPEDMEALTLTVADIPVLAPFLADDWHVLAVSFWRDFSSGRTLERQRPLLMRIINSVAGQKICSNDDDDWSTDAGRQAAVKRITEWAQQRAGKSRADLLIEAVEDTLAESGSWRDVKRQVFELCELGDRRVIPFLRWHLHKEGLYDFQVGEVLSACARIDAAEFLDDAKPMLTSEDVGVRIHAGIVYLVAGETAVAHKTLTPALLEADRTNATGEDLLAAVRALIAEGSSESRRAMAGLLEGDRLKGVIFAEENVLRAMMAAELVEPYHYLRRELRSDRREHGRSVAREMAHDIRWLTDDPEAMRIFEETEEFSSKQVRLLLKWVEKKMEELEAAESEVSP